MLIIMKSRLILKLGHIGLKPRLLGQIIEKACVHSRGHRCDPKFMKLCVNVNPYLVYTLEGTVLIQRS